MNKNRSIIFSLIHAVIETYANISFVTNVIIHIPLKYWRFQCGWYVSFVQDMLRSCDLEVTSEMFNTLLFFFPLGLINKSLSIGRGCSGNQNKTRLCSLFDIDVKADAQCITMYNFQKRNGCISSNSVTLSNLYNIATLIPEMTEYIYLATITELT